MEHLPTDKSPEEEKFEYYQKDLQLTDEQLHKPLLDVGSGPGNFVKYLRDTLGNDAAWGVEYGTKKAIAGEGAVVNANGLELPFHDDTFFTVTAHNYLPMFVEDPEEMKRALWELIRVAQHGGSVCGDITTIESAAQYLAEVSSDNEKATARPQAERRYAGALHVKDILDNIAAQGYGVSVHDTESGKHILTITKP